MQFKLSVQRLILQFEWQPTLNLYLSAIVILFVPHDKTWLQYDIGFWHFIFLRWLQILLTIECESVDLHSVNNYNWLSWCFFENAINDLNAIDEINRFSSSKSSKSQAKFNGLQWTWWEKVSVMHWKY